MTTRADLQLLAQSRLAEARVLLDNKFYSGAYYLAGYSVELALKAIIAGEFAAHAIPDKTLVNQIHTHDLVKLVLHSGLQPALRKSMAQDDRLASNWEVVKAWSEATRYRLTEEGLARELVDAVSDPTDGVLTWIQAHWERSSPKI